MKYIKYLVLALIVSFVASSCTQDKPDFNWKDADYSKAFVQVYYMSLVNSTSANNIKYITINGTEYSYDHQSMISPYNFAPSSIVGSAYSTTPGKCTIKLETEALVTQKNEAGEVIKDWTGEADSTKYERTIVYEGTTEVELKAGVVSQVIVWNNDGSAPHVHEFGTPPVYNDYTPSDTSVVDTTGNVRLASARFYNYLWDEPGLPTEARLFFDVRRKSNGEIVATYPSDGVGLAFGESTDYFTTELYKDQILGSSGYIYVRQDIRAVWPEGSKLYPEGKETILLKNDYWTTYMGRSYHYFYHGDLNGQVRSKKLTRFTAK